MFNTERIKLLERKVCTLSFQLEERKRNYNSFVNRLGEHLGIDISEIKVVKESFFGDEIVKDYKITKKKK